MRLRPFLLMRVGIAALFGLSVAATLPSVARHMAGIVLLESPARPALPKPPVSTAIDLAPILAFAPFGRAAQPSIAPGTLAEIAPDLRLRGIFAASTGISVAMLEVGTETDLFRKGQKVTGAFELTLISEDYVELTDAKQIITLRFDDTEATDTDTKEITPPDTASASLLDRLKTGLVVPVRFEKPTAPETTSEYIDYWRGRIRKNPQAVLDEIGLKPTDDGYVIAQQHDIGVRLAGLKSGDLVRSVNGQSVGNPEDDRQFYDRIATSGQARLEIERGGRLLTLSFPLR